MQALSPNHLVAMEAPLAPASNWERPVSSQTGPEAKMIPGRLIGVKAG